MFIIIFLIPIITSIILAVCFRKKVIYWEYALLFVSSLLCTGLVTLICKDVNASDTEYLGYYVTKISHYDKWNERQRRTRTHTVGTGKNRRTYTEVYYVTVTHPEQWELTLNNNHTRSLSEERFNQIKKKFDTPEVFRDMHRNYFTIDGDAQDYFYPKGNIDKVETYTETHSYKNKVGASKSIFKFIDISYEEKDSLKLFDYPDIKNHYQPVVLGINLPKSETHYIDVINALYGKDKEFRMYMLFFENADPTITEYQKSYWQGGNKNELVLCLGYSGNKITWCEGFSWSDEPVLETICKTYFLTHNDIHGLKEFSEYITPCINNLWERKNFDDFEYVSVDLSMTQLWVILILTILCNIGIAIYVVVNEYDL